MLWSTPDRAATWRPDSFLAVIRRRTHDTNRWVSRMLYPHLLPARVPAPSMGRIRAYLSEAMRDKSRDRSVVA